MKFLSGCMALTLVLTGLTACGDKKKHTPPPAKTATDGNGNCTPEVLADLKTLEESAKSFLTRVTDDMADLLDPSRTDAANARLSAKMDQFQKEIESFRSTYGDFSCYDVNNRSMLNPQPLYKALEDMKTKMKATQPQSAPIGRDGECTDAFKADHAQMQKDIKPLVHVMMVSMREIMQKRAGASIEQEKFNIKKSSEEVEKIVKGFRAKYPGSFACNLTSETGHRLLVSSEEIDKSIEQSRIEREKIEMRR